MSAAVQRRRGTAAQMATFTGLAGEIVVITDTWTVALCDGATAGGIPLARADQVLATGGGGTAGDLLYSTGGTATGRIADVTVGSVLLSGGVGAAPAWGKVSLTVHVTGVLPIINGGTGAATAAVARSSLGAAALGSNADITALSGLTTPLSLSQGGTGAVDAKTARAALGLDKATSVGNVAYAIQATDRTVLLTAALTAPRTWTLPAASTLNPGSSLRITDQVGGISATNTLTLATSGTDKINGASAVVFSAAYTDFQLVTDGAGSWTFDIQGIARGGTGATTAAGALAALGAAKSGANADITSLSGLTTPLSLAEGGTGAATAALALAALGGAAEVAEAAFTPTFTFDTNGDMTVSYTTQVGRVYRVGKLVFVYVSLVFVPTYSTSTGKARVSGLPVTPSSTAPGAVPITQLSGSTAIVWPASATMLYGQLVAGQTYAVVTGSKSGAAPSQAGPSSFASGNTITLVMTGVYESV